MSVDCIVFALRSAYSWSTTELCVTVIQCRIDILPAGLLHAHYQVISRSCSAAARMTDSSNSQVTVTGQQIAAPAAEMQASSRSSPMDSSGSELQGYMSALPQGGGESAGELSARSRSNSRPRTSGLPALRDGDAQMRGRTLDESAQATRSGLGVRPRATVSRGPTAGELRANRQRAGQVPGAVPRQ